jgi:hypothetical protein
LSEVVTSSTVKEELLRELSSFCILLILPSTCVNLELIEPIDWLNVSEVTYPDKSISS